MAAIHIQVIQFTCYSVAGHSHSNDSIDLSQTVIQGTNPTLKKLLSLIDIIKFIFSCDSFITVTQLGLLHSMIEITHFNLLGEDLIFSCIQLN